MNSNEIYTEEYYIASLDLFGMKEMILNDKDDTILKRIKDIYNSWINIKGDLFFSKLRIKFFSDNVVVAIKCEYNNALDNLLEFVADMVEHLHIVNLRLGEEFAKEDFI